MQKFRNIVNVLFVAISLSSRGLNRDNVFLYEKNVYARGRTSCLQDNFSRDYILNSALFTYIIFSLTHLLIMFYADSDPPFLSPSPLICACSTNDFSLLRYHFQVDTYLVLRLAYTITEELTD